MEAKCTLLKRSSKKYIEGLHAFSKCQEEFASSLAEFCEDMDTDEFDLGESFMRLHCIVPRQWHFNVHVLVLNTQSLSEIRVNMRLMV